MAQVTVEQALRVAGEKRREGKLAEAEGIYRQVLAAAPGSAEALYGLGLLAGQVGKFAAAAELLGKAAALCPNDAGLWSNLGEFYRRAGKLEAAVEALEKSLRIKEGNALAHFNLGVALNEQGRADEAIAAYRRAIALEGSRGEFYVNLGGVLEKKERLEEARAAYEAAVRIKPALAGAHHNLANVLKKLGRRAEAIAGYRRAVELDGRCAEAYDSLGVMLGEEGKAEEGEAAIRRAVELNPRHHDFHNNLGNLLNRQGRYEEALACYLRAVELKPDYAEGHYNLGTFMLLADQFDEALGSLRRAVELQPGLADAHNNLGNVLRNLGRLEEAMACYERAAALAPEKGSYFSNRLYTMNCLGGYDAAAILAKSVEWDRRYGQRHGPSGAGHDHERSPERRLRIGYVSADFRLHSVAFFLLRLLEERDRERFHVTCYSNNTRDDAVTGRFHAAADAWRDIVRLTDAEAAGRIREDGIDILVDLTGHTAGSRLGIFARKPAPVQVSYLGYPGTTGLEAMDYRLSDAWADPPAPLGEADRYSTEEIVRLAATAWCFEPLSGSPEVGALPALAGNGVTFGTFNNFGKVTEEMMGAWAEILRRVPGGRLVLKNAAMASGVTAARVRGFFAGRGVAGERLELAATQKESLDHLRWYGRIDVALDTFPYHGTTTTCEALWMGAPVVTLAGERHASRVGVSLLTNVGLKELIAGSAEEYVAIAAGLAGDLDRLAELRRGMRERMKGSALMDAKGMARAVEEAYREMWRRWCGGEGKR